MRFDGKFITLHVALVSFFGCIYFFVSRKMIDERRTSTLVSSFAINETYIQTAKVLVVTRVHRGSAQAMINPHKIVDFVKKTLPYSTRTVVCVSNHLAMQ